jgi:hypothetical protein
MLPTEISFCIEDEKPKATLKFPMGAKGNIKRAMGAAAPGSYAGYD